MLFWSVASCHAVLFESRIISSWQFYEIDMFQTFRGTIVMDISYNFVDLSQTTYYVFMVFFCMYSFSLSVAIGASWCLKRLAPNNVSGKSLAKWVLMSMLLKRFRVSLPIPFLRNSDYFKPFHTLNPWSLLIGSHFDPLRNANGI